jgi:hypothetical protein
VRNKALEKTDGLPMFHLMIICPALIGIALTRLTEGRAGFTSLFFAYKKMETGYALVRLRFV